MQDWIITLIQAIAPSLLVGILLATWNAKQNKRTKMNDKKETTAREKECVKLALLVATAELSHAIAMAIKRGTANGEVEAAIERYDIAIEKFRDFERKRLYDN